VEVLADLLRDSAVASLSFVGGELRVPAVNKNDGHERAQVRCEGGDGLCELPSEHIFVVGSGSKDFGHGVVPGEADVLQEFCMIVVEDESREDGGVEVRVRVFLEQDQVCNAFKGGEKEIDNFIFGALTFQFGNFADGGLHSRCPGGCGSFNSCS